MTDLMNEWQEFVTQRADAPSVAPTHEGFFAALTEYGLIAASGEEAANFLHNQLTNDVLTLAADNARLAGYCSPKGRLLATMLTWRSGDDIMLMLPKQLQAAIQKRLQMYVLRAKVKLRDAGAEFAILGLAGAFDNATLATYLPGSANVAYSKQETDTGNLIRLPDAAGVPRALWITPTANAINAWPTLEQTLRLAPATAWQLTEIEAGTPWITLPTQEKFVPQMINFEVVGGVNFKKGCYPGQEIVARSQYLGKLKRRMLLAKIGGTQAEAGMEVFSEADPEQPCGMIVNAQTGPDGDADCLVEIKLAQAESAAIHLGAATGPTLRFLPLPYALPDGAD